MIFFIGGSNNFLGPDLTGRNYRLIVDDSSNLIFRGKHAAGSTQSIQGEKGTHGSVCAADISAVVSTFCDGFNDSTNVLMGEGAATGGVIGPAYSAVSISNDAPIISDDMCECPTEFSLSNDSINISLSDSASGLVDNTKVSGDSAQYKYNAMRNSAKASCTSSLGPVMQHEASRDAVIALSITFCVVALISYIVAGVVRLHATTIGMVRSFLAARLSSRTGLSARVLVANEACAGKLVSRIARLPSRRAPGACLD